MVDFLPCVSSNSKEFEKPFDSYIYTHLAIAVWERRSSETYGMKWIGRFSIRGYRFEKNLSRSQRLNPLHFSKPPSSSSRNVRSTVCASCVAYYLGSLEIWIYLLIKIGKNGKFWGREKWFVRFNGNSIFSVRRVVLEEETRRNVTHLFVTMPDNGKKSKLHGVNRNRG